MCLWMPRALCKIHREQSIIVVLGDPVVDRPQGQDFSVAQAWLLIQFQGWQYWTLNILVSVVNISNSQTSSSKDWTENGWILVWKSKRLFSEYKGWKANSHFLQNVSKQSTARYAHLSPQIYVVCVAWCGMRHQELSMDHQLFHLHDSLFPQLWFRVKKDYQCFPSPIQSSLLSILWLVSSPHPLLFFLLHSFYIPLFFLRVPWLISPLHPWSISPLHPLTCLPEHFWPHSEPLS